MQTPAHRTTGLQLALAALFASACTTDPEPGDEARLAVVFTTDDGRELAVGTYDAESGELTFIPDAQDDMREQLAAAGYSASVALDGETAEVDLDAGIAWTAVELEDGDTLELRIARPGSPTLTLGRLVLQDGDAFRLYTTGNKTGRDDWLASGV